MMMRVWGLCVGVVMVLVSLAGCGQGKRIPADGTKQDRVTVLQEKNKSQVQEVKEVQKEITGTGIEMVRVPGGTFEMGDNRGEDDEKPVHKVTVGPFWIDTHEVTQESYQELVGQNPSKFKNPKNPVEQVGWFAAIRYCNMRSLKEHRTPCYDIKTLKCDFSADGYRLPTEAEWEYACRAGTRTAYSFGNDVGNLGHYAWFEDNAGKKPHPVGQKKPNPWGLYDMHGNVWEWCQDFYDETYYAHSPTDAPCNLQKADERVLRGGGWDAPADSCRSAVRASEEPGLADVCFGYDAYGFRCVRKAVTKTSGNASGMPGE